MGYDFEVSDTIPSTPHETYEAWMSSEGHSAMTGAVAQVDPRVGGAHSAWDGYITGRTVALEPGRRIVQTWRTSDFADEQPDSQIEVLLEPVEGGTRLTIRHTNVPDGQSGYEQGGWQESYFNPMRAYFTDTAR
jgi:activator of HSP90 ATPase